jgi:hypothetical protein
LKFKPFYIKVNILKRKIISLFFFKKPFDSGKLDTTEKPSDSLAMDISLAQVRGRFVISVPQLRRGSGECTGITAVQSKCR